MLWGLVFLKINLVLNLSFEFREHFAILSLFITRITKTKHM